MELFPGAPDGDPELFPDGLVGVPVELGVVPEDDPPELVVALLEAGGVLLAGAAPLG